MTMGPMSVLRDGTQPAQKSKDLRGTVRRLLARLRPERFKFVLALFLGVTSVGFVVSGPEILGRATNGLVNGIVGKQVRPGTTKAQAIQLLRDHGHGQIAAMIAGMNITPGIGVDINELGRVLEIGRASCR